MTRFSLAIAALAATLIVAPGRAAAQPPGPRVGSPPPVGSSPYLNLIRGGNSPAVNYYGVIRPQLQISGGLRALEQQFEVMQAGAGAGGGLANDVLITGRGATFMNLGGYFLSTGGGNQGRSMRGTASGTTVGGAPNRTPRPGPR